MDTAMDSCRLAVIGRGRMGSAVARALRQAGVPVAGPWGRDFDPAFLVGEDGRANTDVALLCVPDDEIAAVACQLAPGPVVGHCSGVTGLAALSPHERFSLHPLMTLTGAAGMPTGAAGTRSPSPFAGAGCAIAGSSPRALRVARQLAGVLEMHAIEIAEDDRAAYHAAAAIASNFLITLEAAAERMGDSAGLPRELLVPLVRATVENWSRLGARRALTGPIVRGDEGTVERHRRAVSERAPELLELFDALADATRALASRSPAGRSPAAQADPRAGAPPPVARTAAHLRSAVRAAKAAGETVGLVPTMGALHEGHLSLIRRARSECDQVIVSVFVNPRQFAPGEDLAAYPRDPARDASLAREAGATVLFVPSEAEMYPSGFSTSISVSGVGERLCGAARGPEHFSAVATVVAKLLHLAGPDIAYFGQKDAQQAVVIRRMVADLAFPVRIVVCPTVRERDGLAMSSRNAYLSPGERARAVALRRALEAAEAAFAGGERSAAALVGHALEAMASYGVAPEYLELVDPDTLEPVSDVTAPALLALAAKVGSARLIDNTVLGPGIGRPAMKRAAASRRNGLSTTGRRRSEIGAEQRCNA